MKIEVKNVKYAAFASEETMRFEATVYIDGVKAGTAKNEGHGGSNMYHPWPLADRFNAYGKTLPASTLSLGEGREPITMEQDVDSLITDLVADWLARRDFDRMMTKPKIAYIKDGSVWTTSFKGGTKELIARFLADSAKLSAWRDKNSPEVILNLLPPDEAFKAYMKVVNPSKDAEDAPAGPTP